MTTSYHQDCCTECESVMFWQPGFCCDERSDLVKQFAEENASALQALRNTWYNTSLAQVEKQAVQEMKDLYHDFLKRQNQVQSEGFLLEEMAKVTESFALLKKEPVSVQVGVSV